MVGTNSPPSLLIKQACRTLIVDNVSLRPPFFFFFFTHSPTVLTNPERLDLVTECNFYALEARTQTI